MNYDFTTILDRQGQDSIAANHIPYDHLSVDEGFSVLPMWVADMSFPVFPGVTAAIEKRLQFPNFGYFDTSDAYYRAIIDWHRTQKNVTDLSPENIGYENGVLGGVAAAIAAFTAPGEKILLHSPTYVGFTGVLKSLGRTAVHSPLKRDENGIWRMDYEDMDRKLKENHIHLAIFCSPHNPTGRVWEKEELERAMAIFRDNQCIVLSDEIWSDIILPGHHHIPTQSVSEDARSRTIAFYAPSKTFSLAGLIGSYHIVYNPYLADRLKVQSNSTHYNSINVLSMHALIGAYTPEGREWVRQMSECIDQNVQYVSDFLNSQFEGVSVMRSQGTYMMYVDIAQWCHAHGVSADEVRRRGARKGVLWQNGDDFLVPNTIRINVALPHVLVCEAMDRLKKYVFI